MTPATQDSDAILLKKLKDLEGKSSGIILIFGKTRAGKSTFINDVKGKKVVDSTSSMTSDTTDTCAVKVKLSGGRTVHLIDTIGFGGSDISHSHPDLAARYIDLFHNKDGSKGPKISAFLYFIDIKDAAGLDAGSKLNLPFVDAFIGEGLHRNLCFVINKWSRGKEDREEEEEREEQWKSVLGKSFPKARVTRLHHKPSRASEKKITNMTELEKKKAQAKYKKSTRQLVEFALEKTAEDHTLVEKEIGDGNGPIGSITISQIGTDIRKNEIEEKRRRGNGDEADVMLGELEDINDTPIDKAGNIALARQMAREAGEKAMGGVGGEIGEFYNKAGEKFLGAYSGFMGPDSKQASAMQKTYHELIVPRTAALTEVGADIAGTPGAMVGTAVGSGLAFCDSVATFWRSVFDNDD